MQTQKTFSIAEILDVFESWKLVGPLQESLIFSLHLRYLGVCFQYLLLEIWMSINPQLDYIWEYTDLDFA